MPGSYYCSDCGESHASINVVEILTSTGPTDLYLCDHCLDSLTGTVIGPCQECGDIHARHTRRTELEPWTCEECASGHALPSAA